MKQTFNIQKDCDKEKVKRLYAEFIQNVKDEHGIDY